LLMMPFDFSHSNPLIFSFQKEYRSLKKKIC
jgi:hypothetical protein